MSRIIEMWQCKYGKMLTVESNSRYVGFHYKILTICGSLRIFIIKCWERKYSLNKKLA